jgi:hypothetical protein
MCRKVWIFKFRFSVFFCVYDANFEHRKKAKVRCDYIYFVMCLIVLPFLFYSRETAAVFPILTPTRSENFKVSQIAATTQPRHLLG